MEFNIIDVSDDYYANLSVYQRQALRTAQKKKDELERKAEKKIALFRRNLYTNGTQNSSLLEQKTKEISDELEYEIGVLKEQLMYSLSLDGAYNDSGSVDAPYLVDYSLSYTDRYVIVREYYMAIPDPQQRVDLYLKDDVAKQYLGKYYNSLYNVLLTYCK